MRHGEAIDRLPELVGVRPATRVEGELQAHVDRCPRCAARLEALRRVEAALRDAPALEPPPPRLERRILAIPEAGAPRARPRSRRALAAAVCAAAALAFAVGVFVGGEDAPTGRPFSAERTVVLRADRPTVSATVEIGRGEGARLPVRLVATGLPDGGDRFYGLWLSGRAGSVSGGSFRPDGKGRCVVVMQLPPGDWTAVAVTTWNRPPSAQSTVAQAGL